MNELMGHAGLWGIALIVIALVSWMFYRYFAPKSWREWAGAGLVQASSSHFMPRCTAFH